MKKRLSLPKTKEGNVHQQIVDYLKLQFPKVLFRTDFAAGIKMTIGQAVKHKKLQKCKAWPDLFIAQSNKYSKGLFLEIKRDATEIFCKDGSFKKDAHIEEQMEIMKQLTDRGYLSYFACGFEHAKGIIENYLNDN